MNISFSLPNTIDASSFLPRPDGESSQKTGIAKSGDDFGKLLQNDLAAAVSAAELVVPAEQNQQTAPLPGGKILPAALQTLSEISTGEANRMTEADLSALLSRLQQIRPVMSEETPLSQTPAMTARLLKGGPSAIPSTAPTLSGITVALQNDEAFASRRVSELRVRITAAANPVDADAPLPMQSLPFEAARTERPGPVMDAASLANAALTAKNAHAINEGRVLPAAASVLLQTSEGNVVTEADHQPGEDPSTSDRLNFASRQEGVLDNTKPTNPASAIQVENTAPFLRPGSTSPRPLVADPLADVERIVEHLMAARQTDFTKPAAIAVAHREFGALTVTFAPSSSGMNVEIAAENNESQRALAAAMANDRGTIRGQDTAPQAIVQQNQLAPSPHDRSASGSHSGAGFAQGQGNHQSQADNPRSNNSDPRGRHSGTVESGNPERLASDDALYA